MYKRQITANNITLQFDGDANDPLQSTYEVVDIINKTLQEAGLNSQPQFLSSHLDVTDVNVHDNEDDDIPSHLRIDDPAKGWYPSEGWCISYHTGRNIMQVQRIDELADYDLDKLSSDKDAYDLARCKGYIVEDDGKTGLKYERRDTFQSPYEAHARQNGKTFKILGLCKDQRIDAPNELFDIEFDDRKRIIAWHEEIFDQKASSEIEAPQKQK